MKTVWMLIQVKRGFIVEPEFFYSENEAIKRKQVLMANFNNDYDEIEIFKKRF